MKNQYEQQCNAEALRDMGVPVLYDLNQTSIEDIKSWVKSKKIVKVDYTQSPQKVINQMFIDYIKRYSKQKYFHKFNSVSS